MPEREAGPQWTNGTGTEPIAVVGIGCRFPGGVRDLPSFGAVLESGTDVLTEVPANRWGRDAAVANHVGAFLEDIDRFDADHFGILPREAVHIDPQQRVLLEVAWEAMSDSGRSREAWRGSRTAVLMGLLANDYHLLQARTLGREGIGPHYAGGVEFSFAAGRLAYAFDLHGPVAAISSACSSSLLAVHQACQSLRAGECDTAVAGGVSLLIGPELSIFLSSVGAVSRSGRCRPFDAAADGLVRGEGCGVVVLKRLSTALADGDAVRAVIRGSAVTHDGSSMGLTAPNAAAQAMMLRGALAAAGIGPDGVDYVEAHGTGTPLGDQIELGTLAECYGGAHRAGDPLYVGSLKAVFGHMDAAAGIAGLLKAAWVAGCGRVPAQPSFGVANPAIDWTHAGIAVPTTPVPLSRPDRPVRAAVSAFGLSGTNVHVILEAPPSTADGAGSALADVDRGPVVLLASAGRPEALAHRVAQLRPMVATAGDGLGDLVASAATRSTFESHRYAVVGCAGGDLAAALADPDDPPDGAYVGTVTDPQDAPALVFVYSGQGGQWAGMAVDLYERDPGVRAALDECDALIHDAASWSLLDELRRERTDGWERTDVAQPAIFAVQVAVTGWLAARGVTPSAVVGHSMGEVAAAHAAGCLSLADAVRVIVARAELLHGTAGTGRMYAVRGTPEAVGDVLAARAPHSAVAAVNGPTSVIIAGPTDEIDAAAEELEARGFRCRPLRVDAASHSPLVARCGPLLREATASVRPTPATVRLVSSVDPDGDDVRVDAAYWARNLTEPVRLWPAVDRLLARADHVFVEIGPHPVLLAPLTEAVEHRRRSGKALGTLRRDQPGDVALARTLAQLYVAGVDVDWERVTGRPRRYRPLPPVSWGGDRYWLPGVTRGAPMPAARPADAERPTAAIRLALLDADGNVTGEMLARPVDAPAAPAPPAPATPALIDSATAAPAAAAAAQVTATQSGGTAGPDLAARVEATVRAVLDMPASRPLARRRGLFEQGLDSLGAAELRRRLELEFAAALPATVVFQHPTVTALAGYLAGRDVRVPAAPDTGPVPDPEPLDDDGAIAVIGVACRLPGADSPDALWQLLSDGRNCVTEPPPGRRDDPIWTEGGVDIPSRSCYLDDVAGFDAPFFRVSPREAKSLDPQQRLFLEVGWEALEDAGCPAQQLAGQPVGVYVGLEAADYQQLLARDMANVNLYYGTGASFAAVSGRLSYFLGLHGPSIVVDTACSASLTAVHLACQGLRAGDCTVAVVGGAHVMVAPTLMVAMSESNALAPDGWCKTFDEAADGYGCGEGAAAVVLKPLAAARRDGDRVYAVIRASAVNQDGAGGGFTVPNATAQAALIRQALDRAGWRPGDVDYVEAHGTGTPLGDPIEVSALAAAYGPGRDADRPLLIGSAKPNVGHLAAAAGVVGLLKVALSLHHGRIPRHLIDRPSTRIDWDSLPVAIPVESQRWPDRDRPARAGVSSFGLTGTNVHVLVEAAPSPVDTAQPPARTGLPYVLPVTAADPDALRAVAGRMADRVRRAPEQLTGIVSTATHRRTWLPHRLAVVGDDPAEVLAALVRFASGTTPASARVGEAVGEDVEPIVFWYDDALPAPSLQALAGYRQALARCLQQLSGTVGRPCPTGPVAPDGLHDAYVLCHHVAATHLWATFGIRPDDASGAGPGRITAAWARGALSLPDALRAVVDGSDVDVPPDPVGRRVPVLPGGADPLRDLATTVADLFAGGRTPVAAAPPTAPVSLPGYPWQRRSYWYRDIAPRDTAEPWPWLLSGATPEDLRTEAGLLHRYVTAHPDVAALDIAAALASRRPLPHRAALRGAGGLDALRRGEESPEVVAGTATATHGVVMVFPGAGTQWTGMGLDLLDASPAFAAKLAECDALLRPLTGWSVVDVLHSRAGTPDPERVDVIQPTLFAIMVSLAHVWTNHGVRPAAVIGHSQGEIAAAHVAGALTLPDACRIIALRSHALATLSTGGAMASVALDAATLSKKWPALTVAGVNSPRSTVVAGADDAVDDLLAACERDGVRAKRIPVTYASHSPQVEPIRTHLLEVLAGVMPTATTTAICSTVTGDLVEAGTLDAAYWYENLRRPVRFQDAVTTLLARGHTRFIEVSPHPVLTISVQDTAQDAGTDVVVLETLRRADGAYPRLVDALARAWVHGADVAWRDLLPTDGRRPVDLDPAHSAAEAGFWRALDGGDEDDLARLLELASAEQRATLAAALPLLRSWRATQRPREELDSWRYRIAWRTLAEPPAPAMSGTWLVVLPTGDVASPWLTACGAALREHGAAVREVTAGTDLTGLDSHEVAGVVSLLAFDESPHPDGHDVPRGHADTVGLLRALDDAGIDAPWWFLTDGAASTGTADAVRRPVQAQVLGLTRVVGLDDPRHWGGQVDLPPAADGTARRRLCAALAGIAAEDQLAVRASGVLVRRLVRAPLPTESRDHRWDPHGTVLVTGGTGALGGQLARRLARQGARHLLLLSRSGPAAAGVEALVRDIEQAGATAVVAACDVADRAALADVVDGIPADRPLRAVFHLAGATGHRAPAASLDVDQLTAVLRAKVGGALNLDDVLADATLDAFVLFSSNAGVWGSAEQGGYAAANAALDALAQRRRADGRTATSIAWGAWAGEGGSADLESARFLARRGVRAMPVELALTAMRQALDGDETFVAIADVDWAAFAAAFTVGRERPLLAELATDAHDNGTAEPPPDAAAVRAALRAQLEPLPRPARERRLLKLVCTEVAAVLHYDDRRAVAPGNAFKQLGFDSLTGVELRNRLNRSTGLRLDSTLVFDHPTPVALSRFLLTELTGSRADGAPVDPVEPDRRPAASIDAMDVAALVELARGGDV